jgi:TatD DNase family protein
MLDAHCHLDLYPDPSQAAADAEKSGVFVICVTNRPSAFLAAEPHTRRFKKMRLALGLHPLTADLHTDQDLRQFDALVGKTSFIGEIGLDFSREGGLTRDKQLVSFRFALRCLKKLPKFITIHSRGAESAVVDVLDQEYPHPVVFHWYSGSLKNLDAAVERGHFFSINPAMLLSKKGRAIVERIPQERMLTESDGPFVNVGDRTMIPADIKLVEDGLARIWGCMPSAARSVVAHNFRRLMEPVRAEKMSKSISGNGAFGRNP